MKYVSVNSQELNNDLLGVLSSEPGCCFTAVSIVVKDPGVFDEAIPVVASVVCGISFDDPLSLATTGETVLSFVLGSE